MKTQYDSIIRYRSIIRWISGAAMTGGIIGASCFFVPALTGNVAALGLTVALAGIIGLKVALPPLDLEDDWVPIGKKQDAPAKSRANHAEASVKPAKPAKPVSVSPPTAQPVNGIRVAPGLALSEKHARNGVHNGIGSRIQRPGIPRPAFHIARHTQNLSHN